MLWSGRIGEWELHGVSTKTTEQPVSPHGQETTKIALCFHVTRMAAFYFWRCLLPLYLLFTLSMGTFHFDAENLSDRYSTVSTYFLAAFAMLYVVGEALPKTDFLTKIDTVIVMTTVSLTFTGIASLLLKKVHTDSGADIAAWWNTVLEISPITIYVLAKLWIFVPPCSLNGYEQASTVGTSDTVDFNLPPTVTKGSSYYTLEELLPKEDPVYRRSK